MIQKLPKWPEGSTPPEHMNERLLWDKLNEVIEAVNTLIAAHPRTFDPPQAEHPTSKGLREMFGP